MNLNHDVAYEQIVMRRFAASLVQSVSCPAIQTTAIFIRSSKAPRQSWASNAINGPYLSPGRFSHSALDRQRPPAELTCILSSIEPP